MIDPELSGLLIRAGQCQAILYLIAGEEGGVKVNTHISLLREIHPFLEVLRLQLVTIHILTGLKDCIACMQIQFLLSGHQAQRLIHISHQLLRCLSLSGIVAGGLDTAGQRAVMIETDHIVTLPAMKGNGRFHTGFHCCLHVHSVGSVNLFCGFKSCHVFFSFLIKFLLMLFISLESTR